MSSIALSNSRFVTSIRLCSNVERDALDIPIISRYLFCMDCKSSTKYCGRPPQTCDAYSRSGRILVHQTVMPTSVGNFAFLHSRR